MSEQILENQNNLEGKKEISTQDVGTLLKELSDLEISHLWWDGKLWTGEVETTIDQKYKELEKKETNAQEKITFIRDLISHIKEAGVDNFSKIKTLQKSKYMNSETIKEANKLEKKYSNLLKKYPEYTRWIDFFISQNFEHQAYVKIFYNKNINNNGVQYKDIILAYNLWNLNYVNSELDIIEKHINEIQTSNAIKDKPWFFNYFMERIKTWTWESKEGISKVEKIAQLGIYKDSFMVGYSAINILPELLKIPYNKLEKMNSLYMESIKDPKKESVLIEYVDTNLHEYKNTIFEELTAYRNLFINSEKSRLWIENFQGLTYVATDISKLDNVENKKVLEKVLVDITNFWKDNVWKANYIKNFISSHSNFIFWDTTRDSNLKFEIILDILYHIKSSVVERDNVDLTYIIEFEKNYEKRFENDVHTFIQKNKWSEKARKVEVLNEELKKEWLEEGEAKRKEIYEIINSNSNWVQTQPQIKPEKSESETWKEKLLKWARGKEIKTLSEIQWITLTDKWELEIKKPVQIGQNWTIELWQNGELIFMSSLGYTFNFDKDLNTSADTFFKIKNQIDFFDTVWFWFFWASFKQMMETIQSNQSLIWGLGISIHEWVGDENNFLNTSESLQICGIFKKIGFLDNWVNPNNLTNEKVTKLQFTQKTNTLSEKYWENNFFFNQNFNRKWFVEVLKQTSKKEA